MYSEQKKDLKNILGNLYAEGRLRLFCTSFSGIHIKHKFF